MLLLQPDEFQAEGLGGGRHTRVVYRTSLYMTCYRTVVYVHFLENVKSRKPDPLLQEREGFGELSVQAMSCCTEQRGPITLQ